MTYRIKDWDLHFEVSQSRRVGNGKPLSWVAMPTKHDGKGYRRILRSEHGPSMFGAWCAMVQLASKMPERGTFADADGPLDAEDIADSIDFPLDIVEMTLNACCSNRLRWIEKVDSQSTLGAHSERTRTTVYPQDRTGQDRTGQNKTEQDKRKKEAASSSPPDFSSTDPFELCHELAKHLPFKIVHRTFAEALARTVPHLRQEICTEFMRDCANRPDPPQSPYGLWKGYIRKRHNDNRESLPKEPSSRLSSLRRLGYDEDDAVKVLNMEYTTL